MRKERREKATSGDETHQRPNSARLAPLRGSIKVDSNTTQDTTMTVQVGIQSSQVELVLICVIAYSCSFPGNGFAGKQSEDGIT